MTDQPEQGQGAAGEQKPAEQQGPVFRIQRTYLKDVSFESPQSPAVFVNNPSWKPEVAVNLNTDVAALENNLFEVALSITVTVKSNDNAVYLVEVSQAGLFLLQGFDDNARNNMLYSFCPNILFPFARETIANLVMKGGFPQLLLDPVNFDALYAQHLESSRQNAPAPGTPQ